MLLSQLLIESGWDLVYLDHACNLLWWSLLTPSLMFCMCSSAFHIRLNDADDILYKAFAQVGWTPYTSIVAVHNLWKITATFFVSVSHWSNASFCLAASFSNFLNALTRQKTLISQNCWGPSLLKRRKKIFCVELLLSIYSSKGLFSWLEPCQVCQYNYQTYTLDDSNSGVSTALQLQHQVPSWYR